MKRKFTIGLVIAILFSFIAGGAYAVDNLDSMRWSLVFAFAGVLACIWGMLE